jgi:hypothetical protein
MKILNARVIVTCPGRNLVTLKLETEGGPHAPETDAVFRMPTSSATATFSEAKRPGMGMDVDKKLAASDPYKPNALPVNRLEDGSMRN